MYIYIYIYLFQTPQKKNQAPFLFLSPQRRPFKTVGGDILPHADDISFLDRIYYYTDRYVSPSVAILIVMFPRI